MPLNVSDKINSNIDADLVSFKQFQKTNIYDFNLVLIYIVKETMQC